MSEPTTRASVFAERTLALDRRRWLWLAVTERALLLRVVPGEAAAVEVLLARATDVAATVTRLLQAKGTP